MNLTNLFTRFFYASCGVVVDCECSGIQEFLQDSSDSRYFNLTYTWMLFGNPAYKWETFLNPYVNIEYSSDLIFVQKNSSSKLDLVDVYSFGRQRGSSLIGIPFALYDIDKSELQILKNLLPRFDKNKRGNFKGFTLKAVVPVSLF